MQFRQVVNKYVQTYEKMIVNVNDPNAIASHQKHANKSAGFTDLDTLWQHYRLSHHQMLGSDSIKKCADVFTVKFIEKLNPEQTTHPEKETAVRQWRNFFGMKYGDGDGSYSKNELKEIRAAAEREKRKKLNEWLIPEILPENDFVSKGFTGGYSAPCRNCHCCSVQKKDPTKTVIVDFYDHVVSTTTGRPIKLTDKITCKDRGLFMLECNIEYCKEQHFRVTSKGKDFSFTLLDQNKKFSYGINKMYNREPFDKHDVLLQHFKENHGSCIEPGFNLFQAYSVTFLAKLEFEPETLAAEHDNILFWLDKIKPSIFKYDTFMMESDVEKFTRHKKVEARLKQKIEDLEVLKFDKIKKIEKLESKNQENLIKLQENRSRHGSAGAFATQSDQTQVVYAADIKNEMQDDFMPLDPNEVELNLASLHEKNLQDDRQKLLDLKKNLQQGDSDTSFEKVSSSPATPGGGPSTPRPSSSLGNIDTESVQNLYSHEMKKLRTPPLFGGL